MKSQLFKLLSPFPIFQQDTHSIRNGSTYSCSEFCKKKLDNKDSKCIKFYTDLNESKDSGINHKICPYKFSVLSVNNENFSTIITSIYCPSNNNEYKRRHKGKVSIPNKIPLNNLINWVDDFSKNILPIFNNYSKSLVRDLSSPYHDLAKVNGLIKSTTETLKRKIQNGVSQDEVIDDLDKIIKATEFFTRQKEVVEAYRSDFTNISVTPIDLCIYGKFVKSSKLFENKAKGRIHFDTNGAKIEKIRVNTQYIDLIPFILIDNAVKYSRDDTDISVQFTTQANELTISVMSTGNEINNTSGIFDLHCRESSEEEGDGIGLFILKRICDKNSIKLSCSSNACENEYFRNTFTLHIPI